MQLSLAFILGLLVQQSWQLNGLSAQSGNFFSVGGAAAAAKPLGPVFTNVGNYAATKTSAFGGAVASPGYQNPLTSAIALQSLGAKTGVGAFPAFGGFGGWGLAQKLGFGGGLGPVNPALLGGGLGLAGGLGHGAFPGVGLHGAPLVAGFGPVGGVLKKKEPLKLTCRNTEFQKTPYGPRASSVAVTIMKTRDGGDSYGDFPGAFDLHHGPKMSLSIDLSVKVEGAKGPAKVVFTETAAIAGGCDPYGLGGIFTGDDDSDPFKHLFGASFLGLAGGYDDSEGVVTTLSLYPDRPTSVHRDRLDIDKLEHLAGRGLAVVTGVKPGSYGKTEIDGEVLACCALAYDDQPRNLDPTPKPGQYPEGNGYPPPPPPPAPETLGSPPPAPAPACIPTTPTPSFVPTPAS